MSAITSHVLDTSRGRPASGIEVRLELAVEEGWREIGSGRTDDDGRVENLLAAEGAMVAGAYRLIFDVGGYFLDRDVKCFYPRVTIEFDVRDEFQHYHVPLLLSPFGYTTYRGS